MAMHGGTRPGAGRPRGGVTDTRRRIIAAINQGMAQAGRRMYPDKVSQDDEDEAAIQTGAMIVDDMIRAGQGNDVMKLWAAVALKEPEGQTASKKNTLAEALSRLPDVGCVRDVSQNDMNQPQPAEIEGSATHTERGAPPDNTWFAPQVPLLLDDPIADQEFVDCDNGRAKAS